MEVNNKVINHPEREQIIEKILNGESVKSIESWLKKKHPKKRSLQISYATLQKFRKDHLGLEGEVLEDIKAKRRENDSDEEEMAIKNIVNSSSAYQQKIDQIASNKLDADRKILEMLAVVSSRIEFYFNSVVSSNGKDIRDDKMLMDLINTQKGLVQDWKKYVEGVADQKIEHNINVTVVNEQVTVLKNIVFDVLQDMEPALIPIFVEKVNQKLNNTSFESSEYKGYNQNIIGVIDAE